MQDKRINLIEDKISNYEYNPIINQRNQCKTFFLIYFQTKIIKMTIKLFLTIKIFMNYKKKQMVINKFFLNFF